MASLDVIRTLTIRAQTAGLERAAAQLRAVGDAGGDVAQGLEAATAGLEQSIGRVNSATSAFERLERRFSPLNAQLRQYNENLRAVQQFKLQNANDEEAVRRATAVLDGMNNALQQTAERHGRVGQAAHAAGEQVNLNRQQWMNLGYQLQDVTASLASGSSPFTIMVQQGGQVIQALKGPSGTGSITGALGEIGTWLSRLVTPTTAVVTGLVAGAALVYAGWSRVDDLMIKLNTSLSGAGRGTRATAGQLADMAAGQAGASGLSQQQSIQAVTVFARQGNIATDVMRGLLNVTRDYAETTGQDVPAAVEALAQAFKDPTRGADELVKQLNNLNDTQLQLIRNQQASGDVFGAQRTLFASIRPTLKDHEENLTLIGKAWEFIKKASSDVLTGVGMTVSPSFERQAEIARQRVQAQSEVVRDRLNRPGMLSHRDVEALDTAVTEAYSARQRADANAIEREIQADQARANVLSRSVGDLSRQYVTLDQQIQDIDNGIAETNALLGMQSMGIIPQAEIDRAKALVPLLEAARKQMAEMKAAGGQIPFEALRDANRELTAAGLDEFGQGLAQITNRYADLARQAERAGESVEGVQRAQGLAERAFRAGAVRSDARSYAPDAFQRSDLEGRIGRMSEALIDPQKLRDAGLSAQQAQQALERMRTELENLLDPLQEMVRQWDLEAPLLQAVTGAEKAAAEANKAYADTLKQTHDYAQAATAAEIARQRAIIDATKALDEATRSAQNNTRLIGLRPAQRIEEERRQRLEEINRNYGGVGSTGLSSVPRMARSLDYGGGGGTITDILARELGLTRFQAAGITGNLAWESRLNPMSRGDYVNGSPTSFGLGQWHNERASSLMSVPGWQSTETQLAFLIHELQTGSGGVGNTLGRLRGAGSAADAASIFMTGFERPNARTANLAARQQLANQAAGGDFPTLPADSTAKIEDHAEAYNKSKAAAEAATNAEFDARKEWETAGSVLQSFNDNLDSQQSALDAQVSAFGKSTAALAEESAKQMINNQLKQNGVTDVNRYAQAVEQAAHRAGQLAQAQENLARQTQLAQDINQSFSGAISGFVGDLIRGKSAAEALKNALASLAESLINSVLKFALNGLFGGAGGLGGMIATAFGGGAPAAVGHGGTFNDFLRSRLDNPMAYIGAPRLHGGNMGLYPGEFRAILQQGEGILSKSDMAALRGSGSGGPANDNGKVNVTVITPPNTRTSVNQTKTSQGTNIQATIQEVAAEGAVRPGNPLNRAIRTMGSGIPLVKR